MFKKIGRYFKESFAEMKKVSWPGRTEVLQSAKIVIISTIAFALILGLVDFILLNKWLKVGTSYIHIPVTSRRSRELFSSSGRWTVSLL